MSSDTSVPAPSYYTFTPESDIFPTSVAPNITAARAIAGAGGVGNFISISQPERPARVVSGASSTPNTTEDYSSQFAVYPSNVQRYLEAAKAAGQHADDRAVSLGVGIGVGLGVPILIAIAVAITWIVARKRREADYRKRSDISELSETK